MAGAAVENPGGLAGSNAAKHIRGLRSGLNQASIGRVLGTSQFAPMGASIMRAGGFIKNNWRGMSAGKGATDEAKAIAANTRRHAQGLATRPLRRAADWLTAKDYAHGGDIVPFGPKTKGARFARGGVMAARGAAAYAALNVADFLNPFGFGSIND